MEPEFLTVADALFIHRNQIATYGGRHGVRDAGLLESALAQPAASHGSVFLHSDLLGMAAAYLFHVVQNHPFVDGNKRTGAVLALTFLEWNGIRVRPDNEGLVDITLRVASGKAGKHEATAFFRAIAVPEAP